MGLGDMSPDDDDELDESRTVGDLISEFGEEAVKRGISYMQSLRAADEEYRSAAGGEYEEGMEDVFGEVTTEEGQEAVSNWQDHMRDNGIGLGDDE